MSDPIRELCARVRRAGHRVLLETEGLELARALGLRVPRHLLAHTPAEAAKAVRLGDRVVVKVASRAVLHKSDAGGVRFVPATRAPAAVADLSARFAESGLEGFVIYERIEYDRAACNELLAGVRWTDEFGPVVTLGPGGVHTELLSERLGVSVLSPALTPPASLPAVLEANPLTRLAARGAFAHFATRLLEFAAEYCPHPVAELEFNPVVLAPGGLAALDAVVRLGDPFVPDAPPRPLDKLRFLLRPRRVAVVGVSARGLNPGRIIVRNLVREGFSRERILVVKAGCDEIDGCRCVPDLAALPGPVDLLIVGVAAADVEDVVREAVAGRRAESLIVIPGGMGETRGSEAIVAAIRKELHAARATDWRGPVLNGGNCLGVRSVPGRYDTMFIPDFKLPPRDGEAAPLAVISQSGAFAVAKASRLGDLNPRYLVSIGNQADLTIGDYLRHLESDREVCVFACYVEGFRPLDGRAFLEAARRLTGEGRRVLLYRSGRTPEGARATRTHTASIAGDYTVTRELAEAAGVIVLDGLADFEEMARLCVRLGKKRVDGRRLAGVTNAGFEAVAIADHLGRFELAAPEPETLARLEDVLARARLQGIVTAGNPLDLTPIMSDEGYAEAARVLLADPNVDVAVIGCVPLSGALQTLPRDERHHEDVHSKGSVAHRLAEVIRKSDKACIAVVDGGPLYDPMARLLEARGVPTFRSADRALRLFGRYCASRAP